MTRTLDLEAATRAALALLLPMLVLLAVGRIELAVYASFGAFTALFGRSEPYRVRLLSVSAAAIALTASISAGVVIACLGTPLPLLTVALVVVIVLGVMATAVIGWIPGQPVFFVFALLVCAVVPTTWQQAPLAIGVAASSAVLAWLICMSGWMLRRLAGTRHAHRFRNLQRRPTRTIAAAFDSQVLQTATMTTIAALASGAIALSLGIGRPYWAALLMITPLALSMSSLSIPMPIGPMLVDRLIETFIGCAVAVAALLLRRWWAARRQAA
ncbi:hypothetical protein FB562_0608 [Homoserinimonas aerilata]|uniref:Fusaric acid resistance family protein n=1 Tax=Homoserinimonas aerilata TaxID=1162970 RepID=A0A542YHH6_9MICO|nr:FUSC family protein [Homoserinimonas aerilata]TQL47543.1 hypothetical protein FB562_0608 [Homoserinimonas aerilata]